MDSTVGDVVIGREEVEHLDIFDNYLFCEARSKLYDHVNAFQLSFNHVQLDKRESKLHSSMSLPILGHSLPSCPYFLHRRHVVANA